LFTFSYTFILDYVSIKGRTGEGEFMEKEQKILEDYRILKEGGSGEIVEKKSRFIATLSPAASEEEAAAFIEEIKKKYWDARHNCSAFVIGPKAEITRCSDDGEPSGTAGRPILEVLLSEEIRNAAVVVTRYFGGTLLGTGGLVRAYTQAVKEGLKNSKTAKMYYGMEIVVNTDYNGVGKILYLLEKQGLKAKSAEYAQDVTLKVTVPIKKKEGLIKEVIQATGGKCRIEEKVCDYYMDSKEESDG